MSRPDKVLEISKLSKHYRLGAIGSGTLSGDLSRRIKKLRGESDPLLPLSNNGASEGDTIWALRDINLDVYRGEVLGLIGKNGAGKSTLLKLLSRVTSPTEGRIRARGRIASLLEVGTGMHPELTGRENIFLNGAILGMSREEISSKYDEIVDFSGCATYIDTPVKRYSSGMKVRLGFSVAAFLEPEILIVDEVLAVGDAEFQKKAIARMQEVTRSGERTVLFVSHNMTSVRSLCTRAVWLDAGSVAFDGDVEGCIANYLGYRTEGVVRVQEWKVQDAPACTEVRVKSVTASAEGKGIDAPLSTDDALCIEVHAERLMPESAIDCTLQIYSESGIFIAASSSIYSETVQPSPVSSHMVFRCNIPAHFFNQGVYRFGILMLTDRKRTCLKLEDVLRIAFAASLRSTDVWLGTPSSLLLPAFDWTVEPGAEG